MDRIFFEELRLRDPDYTLEVGSGSHAEQTGKIMASLEPIIIQENPDWVVVQGDTNTTLSGALTTAKLNKNLAHVEAGCRSFNRNMPEETNRVVTDHLSQILFAVDQRSYDNLVAEGIPEHKIHLVGSTLTNACRRNQKYARSSRVLQKLGLEESQYLVVTIHRAENTGQSRVLRNLVRALNELASMIRIVFPVHPRTDEALKYSSIRLDEKIKVVEPLGYLDFLKLISDAKFIMTDSGGIQEEAVVLNVPCLILRNETEWDRFVKAHKNALVGTEKSQIVGEAHNLIYNPLELEKRRDITVNLANGASKKILSILKGESSGAWKKRKRV